MKIDAFEAYAHQAGCARVKITPPVGVYLAGYFHLRESKRIRDDLYANAVVVGHEASRVALVGCDLISPSDELTGAAKALIEKETGIPPESVLIATSHTHTGPETRRGGVTSPVCDPWLDELPCQIADAVVRAAKGAFKANLRAGKVRVEGYAFNRLFRLKSGLERFGLRGRKDEVVDRAGSFDPDLQTLGIVDESGRLRAMVVNYAMHPDVIGGGRADFISADWPGELARAVAAVYGEDVVTVFLQGTCGDLNQGSNEPSARPQGGEDKAVSLGRGLAGAAMLAHERAEPMTPLAVWGRMQAIDIPYYTRDETLRRQIEALKARPDGDRTPAQDKLIERFESWPHDNQDAPCPVQTIQIDDVALVGLPGEVFSQLGMDLKRFSPAPQTMVVELANARVTGYVPTTDQALRNESTTAECTGGAYGTIPILSRWLCADGGRRMIDAAHAMLWGSFVQRPDAEAGNPSRWK
jgi:hypothetical protein